MVSRYGGRVADSFQHDLGQRLPPLSRTQPIPIKNINLTSLSAPVLKGKDFTHRLICSRQVFSGELGCSRQKMSAELSFISLLNPIVDGSKISQIGDICHSTTTKLSKRHVTVRKIKSKCVEVQYLRTSSIDVRYFSPHSFHAMADLQVTIFSVCFFCFALMHHSLRSNNSS